MRNIASYNGDWSFADWAGITHRHLLNTPTDALNIVASSNIRINLNYTDGHDVDEDLMTISNCGGNWPRGNEAGITFRELFRSSFFISAGVASLKIRLAVR